MEKDWIVRTADKKSVEEHEYWFKDGKEIIRITGFRWGEWVVTTNDDKEPQFEFAVNGDEKAIEMNNQFQNNNIENVQLNELDDGWYGDVVWPEDMSQEERDRLEELWEEDSYSGWEEDGWVQDETECWVFCDLNIKPADQPAVH